MRFDLISVIFLLCALFSIVRGLTAIFRGQSKFADSEASEHTAESRLRAAKWYGIAELVFGLGVASFAFLRAPLFMIGTFSIPVGLATLVAGVGLSHVIHAFAVGRLVKKPVFSFSMDNVIEVEANVY